MFGYVVNFFLSFVGGLFELWVNVGCYFFVLSCIGVVVFDFVMIWLMVLVVLMVVFECVFLFVVVDWLVVIGLFGYVYCGKGFEFLWMFCESFDDDILICVVGCGIVELFGILGVEVLGEVEGF